MNILIIEDELVAQRALVRALTTNFDDINICAVLDSVEKSVEWLNSCEDYPDAIFMDVELSDGKCFDIFDQIKITCPIVIVTAYNNYAIKAFEVNSIDYLLKPASVAKAKKQPINPILILRLYEMHWGGVTTITNATSSDIYFATTIKS